MTGRSQYGLSLKVNRRRFCIGSILGAVAWMLSVGSCRRASDNEVIAYVSLDAEFSEPVLSAYTAATGDPVLPVFDIESTKTVGLVNRIIAESKHPRSDLFWNNEILHTLRLKELGLLRSFRPAAQAQLPSSFKDPDGMWYGFGARARVFLVHQPSAKENGLPSSIHDLADPKWKYQCGMARPLFGTSATHAAVLFAQWGTDRATEYYQQVHRNSRIYSGNRQVAEAVGKGEVTFGITDTDDAIIQIERGAPVAIVFPDQGSESLGTLLIPNTVCLLRGSRHQEAAERLAAHLLSSKVESQLAKGSSAQIPLRKDVTVRSRIAPKEFDVMAVDFAAAAEVWSIAAEKLRQIFH